MTMPDIDKLIDYENGVLDPLGTLQLFGTLVANGVVWNLQGSYGRKAHNLIVAGMLTEEGEPTPFGIQVAEAEMENPS